jgi:glycine cleavage system aminomethyltransferase T
VNPHDEMIEREREEARQVREFLASPVWTWFKERLEREQATLIARVGSLDLSPEGRAVLCGALAFITRVLNRPAALVRAHREGSPPEANGDEQRPPRSQAAPGIFG